MTTLAVHTPMQQNPARKIGKALYRKQILPLGEITYQGKPLRFTREMHEQIAEAFNDGAFDSVAFQLAPDNNTHTADPERTRGLVKGFELTNDGLDALIEVGDRGRAVLEENPNLAVSARIKLDLTRADGKHYPAAIEHVLGTLDPRVPGMKPWEKVADLAADTTPIVDLTSASFAPERTGMDLKPEDAAKLAKFLENLGDDGQLTVAPEHDLTEAELQAIINNSTVTSTETEPELATASLSADAQQAIDLANATADEASQRVIALSVDLAAQKWRADRAALEADGVPPFLLDLAAPVLELPTDAVIELSNTKTVDVAKVVRDMLDGAKGLIDLSAPAGTIENQLTPASDEERATKVAAYRKHFQGVI